MMIPPEMVNEILWHLPAKSVGRFRSVSKEWLSLLTQPAFIKTHQNTLKRNHHLIFIGDTSLYSHPSHHHEPVLTPTNLLIKLDCSIAFHGSCNGLVLISNRYRSFFYTLVLLNPTTRESVELLPPYGYYHDQDLWCRHTVYGFGYDSVTDDYKIVYLSNKKDTTTFVSVYSLRDNTWRQLIDCPYYIDNRQYGVYLDGYLNWISTEGIITFSLADECFSVVPVVLNLSDDKEETDDILYHSVTKLTVFGGKLAIYCQCIVLLMNEYGNKESWTKFRLDRLDEIPIRHSMIFYDNGKIRVSNECQQGMLLMYDFEKRTFGKEHYLWNSDRFTLAGMYMESLVSPKMYTN